MVWVTGRAKDMTETVISAYPVTTSGQLAFQVLDQDLTMLTLVLGCGASTWHRRTRDN